MQKCSLCGGKVVNGRCEECGMPIPDEHRYTLRSETVHTREVNGEKVLHRVRQPQGRKPAWSKPQRPQRPGQEKPSGHSPWHPYRQEGPTPRKKPLPRLLWWVIFIALGVNILGMMVGSLSR